MTCLSLRQISIVSALSLMATAPLFPQLAAVVPWQAEWIGPAAPPTADIIGASWIWSDEPGGAGVSVK
jgi:hypothetical protein